jgi:hypothetical protein
MLLAGPTGIEPKWSWSAIIATTLLTDKISFDFRPTAHACSENGQKRPQFHLARGRLIWKPKIASYHGEYKSFKSQPEAQLSQRNVRNKKKANNEFFATNRLKLTLFR